MRQNIQRKHLQLFRFASNWSLERHFVRIQTDMNVFGECRFFLSSVFGLFDFCSCRRPKVRVEHIVLFWVLFIHTKRQKVARREKSYRHCWSYRSAEVEKIIPDLFCCSLRSRMTSVHGKIGSWSVTPANNGEIMTPNTSTDDSDEGSFTAKRNQVVPEIIHYNRNVVSGSTIWCS